MYVYYVLSLEFWHTYFSQSSALWCTVFSYKWNWFKIRSDLHRSIYISQNEKKTILTTPHVSFHIRNLFFITHNVLLIMAPITNNDPHEIQMDSEEQSVNQNWNRAVLPFRRTRTRCFLLTIWQNLAETLFEREKHNFFQNKNRRQKVKEMKKHRHVIDNQHYIEI